MYLQGVPVFSVMLEDGIDLFLGSNEGWKHVVFKTGPTFPSTCLKTRDEYLPPKSNGYSFGTPCTPPLVFTGSISMNMTRISSLVLTAPRFVFWRLKGIVRGVLRVKWLSIKQWFVSGDMISDWAVHTPFITPRSLMIQLRFKWLPRVHKGF